MVSVLSSAVLPASTIGLVHTNCLNNCRLSKWDVVVRKIPVDSIKDVINRNSALGKVGENEARP